MFMKILRWIAVFVVAFLVFLLDPLIYGIVDGLDIHFADEYVHRFIVQCTCNLIENFFMVITSYWIAPSFKKQASLLVPVLIFGIPGILSIIFFATSFLNWIPFLCGVLGILLGYYLNCEIIKTEKHYA